MPFYLGDKTGNHLAFTIIAIDRTAEDNNCMLEVSVKSGNFTGATTLFVHYSDFVLFVYHLGMLVKDEIDIVPELQDQKWGSLIDVENTVGGLLYEDDNDGLQSVTFDFEIDDVKIHQFVTELKQDHFSHRNVNGLDFDFFTTAIITLYPTIRFQIKGDDSYFECYVGRHVPTWKSRDKSKKKGPLYFMEVQGLVNVTYETIGELITAPNIRGQSLIDLWTDIEILDIDGTEMNEFLDQSFGELAQI